MTIGEVGEMFGLMVERGVEGGKGVEDGAATATADGL